jgi:inosose dehydratase
MRIGYQTITWGGVVGDPVGVTSVKSLTYRVNGSMERAIADIAAEGYAGVEMFDGNVADFADRPADLIRTLDEHGVVLSSVYTGANFIYDEILDDEMWRIDRAAGLAAEFGADALVVGGGAQRHDGIRPTDYDRLGAALDRVTELADRRGLAACYHPHLSTIVESPEQLDLLMARTAIGFCPDTAHLMAGGGDPAALIRRFPDRVRHVHLKDFTADPFAFLPLGQGTIDFTDVMSALRSIGYDHWLVVELDSYDGDPRDAARISKLALDGLLAAPEASRST